MNARLAKSCIVSVFSLIIYLALFCGARSFAECPKSYPVDCGDGWCCESNLLCLLPSFAKEVVCTEEEEEGITCPLVALYGEDSDAIARLRYFRDNVLIETPMGIELIQLYYTWSPVIMQTMEEDEVFKEEVKEMVDGVLFSMGGN
jgi:hypothetical protein